MLLKITHASFPFRFVKIKSNNLIVSILQISGHVGPKPFFCQKCHKKAYKNKGSLKRHENNECGKKPQWMCTYHDCNYRTHQKCNLERHVTNIHGDLPGIPKAFRKNRIASSASKSSSKNVSHMELWPLLKISEKTYSREDFKP